MSGRVRFLVVSFPLDGDDALITADEFAEANADDPDLVSEVLATVERGGVYRGGGGAAVEFSVAAATQEQLAECPPDVADFVEAVRVVMTVADRLKAGAPEAAKAIDRLAALHEWAEASLRACEPGQVGDA